MRRLHDIMNPFSPDYARARQRFRKAISHLGWNVESHPIDVEGPNGEELSVDVAVSPSANASRAVVVTSGLHGIEGFFGSAVQIDFLERYAKQPDAQVRLVFIHALNPYGFAWLRRFDSSGVDPNRNFLLPGEAFEGSPAGYAQFDRLLNPKRPPSPREFFTLRALMTVARHGMPKLKQAIATGQYDYPSGLFFGGHKPSPTQTILADHLQRWLADCSQVLHLDFHTGLGGTGAWKLLIDYNASESQQRKLSELYGLNSWEFSNAQGVAYKTRGSLGPWVTTQNLHRDYIYCCAEFGTYKPIAVLGGLRAENQAHHWGKPDDPSTYQAKETLKELFCPASETWRKQVIAESRSLIERAVMG